MSVKWIITDLDGCVSPEESVPWALEPFVEFARQSRAASAGESDLAPLTLCTGRPQPYAEVLMKILDIRAPAICENGAVLYSLHDN
ncbi:MAG: HAD hydrolase family protein, partial [Candidatus Hydrogenedentes bacterium]|nr:HAD hydrolase family protein [Candidatus Hydrogenedentota bacterium]